MIGNKACFNNSHKTNYAYFNAKKGNFVKVGFYFKLKKSQSTAYSKTCCRGYVNPLTALKDFQLFLHV